MNKVKLKCSTNQLQGCKIEIWQSSPTKHLLATHIVKIQPTLRESLTCHQRLYICVGYERCARCFCFIPDFLAFRFLARHAILWGFPKVHARDIHSNSTSDKSHPRMLTWLVCTCKFMCMFYSDHIMPWLRWVYSIHVRVLLCVLLQM